MLSGMTMLISKESEYSSWKTMDEVSTKSQLEKTQKHFRTRKKRTKKIFTLGRGEVFLVFIYVVIQGLLFNSLVPTDAKLEQEKNYSSRVTHKLHNSDYTNQEKSENYSRGKQYTDLLTQGKIFDAYYFRYKLNFQTIY